MIAPMPVQKLNDSWVCLHGPATPGGEGWPQSSMNSEVHLSQVHKAEQINDLIKEWQ